MKLFEALRLVYPDIRMSDGRKTWDVKEMASDLATDDQNDYHFGYTRDGRIVFYRLDEDGNPSADPAYIESDTR